MNRTNNLYYFYRVLKWRLIGDRSPIVAALKITQRCNLSCKHCIWKNRITQDLPLSNWKDIIDDLYRQGVASIAIEGGEPTLRNDASKIVDYINSKNMISIFVTNGTRDISSIDPHAFAVSIDGTKNTHDKIRGNGVFHKMMSILKKNRDKRIVSLTTISKINAEEIEPMCKFFSQTDFVYRSWFHFAYPYSDIQVPTLNTKERMKIANKIIKLKKRYPKILNSTSYLEMVGRQKKCYPWLFRYVTADGKQQHSCMVKNIEKEDCSKCDLGTYGELSRTYEFKGIASLTES